MNKSQSEISDKCFECECFFLNNDTETECMGDKELCHEFRSVIKREMSRTNNYKIYEDYNGFTVRDLSDNYVFETETKEGAELIIYALEKQTLERIFDNAFCPTCEKFMLDKNNYCPECGQSLDWSE